MGNTAEDEMKYTINELANSKGVSQPVREALLHMEAELVKANAQAEHFEREWYLRGDELDATNRQVEILSDALAESRRQRQWVGLTDEAIWSEYQTLWPFHPAEEPRLAKDIAKFARAIEAAHGITEKGQQ